MMLITPSTIDDYGIEIAGRVILELIKLFLSSSYSEPSFIAGDTSQK